MRPADEQDAKSLAAQVVRLALFHEYRRQPLKREVIVKTGMFIHCLNVSELTLVSPCSEAALVRYSL